MKIDHLLTSPYMQFNREQWASLRHSEPQPLTESELFKLKGINENLSINEVTEIYLPLSRLLNFYIASHLRRHSVLEDFLGTPTPKVPYIISIAGSVAVGKSTTARLLQSLLKHNIADAHVELVTTDGFLLPNNVLQAKGLMKKKGFPQSYDIHGLLRFMADLKSGKSVVQAPVYSHLIYDIVPNKIQSVEKPDIIIIEGLNVLQSGMDYPHDPHRIFVSDFVDFSIYVDAEEELLKQWYIERFLKLRLSAFNDPNSYFHSYVQITEENAIEIANNIWQEINSINLHKNILPTRERANLIMTKDNNHEMNKIWLRK